jgi:hydrogenase expression/formation protein HypC
MVDEANRLARVDVAGVQRNVNVGLLDSEMVAGGVAGVQPGDWVLIHVGFALSKVDEEEALATRKLLEQMGAEYEQELEELKGSVIE